MKKLLKNTKLLWLACFAFAGAAAFLQVCAVLLCYEPDTNYFTKDLPLSVLAAIFAILGAICGSLAARATDVKKLAPSPFSEQPIPAPSAFGFLAVLILFFANKQAFTAKTAPYILIFSAIALLYSALYAFKPLRMYKSLFAFLGFGTLLSIVLLTAYYYFDVTVEMNAPLKISVQTGLLFALVYYTGELRYLLGSERPRFYLTLSAWALAVGSLSAIAVPVAYFTGKLDRSDYAAGGLLVLCILLTVLTRLHALLRTKTAATSPEEAEEASCDTDGNGDSTI